MAVTLAEFTPEIGPSALRSWSKGLRPGIDEVTVRTTPGGRTYICETGQHRYHRDVEAARWCAWRALPIAGSGVRERESTPSGDILDRINIAIWRLERKGQRVTHIELNAEDYTALKAQIIRDLFKDAPAFFGVVPLRVRGVRVEQGMVSRAVAYIEEEI